MSVQEEVIEDLNELKKLGGHIPPQSFEWVNENPEEVQELRDNGMKISEIGDHAIHMGLLRREGRIVS